MFYRDDIVFLLKQKHWDLSLYWLLLAPLAVVSREITPISYFVTTKVNITASITRDVSSTERHTERNKSEAHDDNQ